MRILPLPVGPLEANCYIVWEDSTPAVVIDPGGQPDVILTELVNRGLTLSVILLTHAHFDHILAAPALQEESGAPVWIHRLDADGVKKPLGPLALSPNRPPNDLRLLEDGQVLTVGTLPFSIRHTPGHSPGSCCIVCQNAIFSGDTLFSGDIGRVDLPGGSPSDMRRTLADIAAWTGEYDVYPGHGESTALAREQRSNPYLQPPYNL